MSDAKITTCRWMSTDGELLLERTVEEDRVMNIFGHDDYSDRYRYRIGQSFFIGVADVNQRHFKVTEQREENGVRTIIGALRPNSEKPSLGL